MQVTELTRKKMNKKPALEVEEMIKKLRKEHSRLVKGMFEFLDAKGGWMDFNYRYFPEDPIQRYRFVHGEICEIPMGIVKHLNNTYYKVRSLGTETQEGKFVPGGVEKMSRLRFTPVDFF